VLAEVRLAVDDWRPMRQACLDAVADLAASRSPNLAEYEDFLRWLEANHFTFLGHRRYRYVEDRRQPAACATSCAGFRPRHPEARRGAAVRRGVGGGEAMAQFARGLAQHPDRSRPTAIRWSIATVRWIA
jgi:glutamate dehydrogenase